MPREKISKGFALNLQRLLAGEPVNAGAFGNKRQLKKLEELRAVVRRVTGRNRAVCFCPDPSALRSVLQLHFGIHDLTAYLNLLEKDHADGEESLRATTSTKTLRRRSLQGFFIKGFGTDIRIGKTRLDNLPDGVEYFVRDHSVLKLSSMALIVGVENPECFVKADRLLDLFPQKAVVLVLRYHSNSPVEWLKSIPNDYLHFGDFDPAGIAIYCNEYRFVLGEKRCRFLVPDGIGEQIRKYGDSALFDRQRQLWPPKQPGEERALAELIATMEQCGKGLEQEWLLRGEV
ncbi:hypothetical protein EGM51_16295 [Verrucomicrobia bacterium S94]|nr:hypothetical protein EGM51_16295 [Verrucomicrobia bacterium S94]